MVSRFSIAVLRFTETVPDKATSYLSDGITMEIIHALSQHRELHVTSRYSSMKFSSGNEDLQSIGQQLNVAWLADGNTHLTGDTIQVTAQLIHAGNGLVSASVSEKGNPGAIEMLAKKIASAFAEKIKGDSGPPPATAAVGSVNTEAMEEFMKGHYLLNRLESEPWQKMVGHFRRALTVDPGFARARVALCHAYSWLSSIGLIDPVKARRDTDELINTLFSQNHRISEVYQLQSEKFFWIEWKPLQALDQITTALELNRSNAPALVMKGLILASVGRIEESLDALYQAERLDPFGENTKYCIGLIYRYTGDFEKAAGFIRQSLEISPTWLAPYFSMLEVLGMQRQFQEAEAFISRSSTVPGFQEMIPVFHGLMAAYAGREEEALTPVREITRSPGPEAVVAPLYYYLGLINLQLRRHEEALTWIERGLRFRSTPLLFIHIDVSWDPLRNDPRFRQLVKQSGLPAMAPDSTPDQRYRKARLPDNLVGSIGENLRRVLEENRAYLDPTLSLSLLAEMCDISVNQLSQYLNGHLGRSFYEHMNAYRLRHFLEKAGQNALEKMSILGLAYESGFNSKTTFNTYFRKEMHMTPREFLKK